MKPMMQQLPPGFKFDPADEELVLHFLYSKVASLPNSHTYTTNNTLIPELENFYDHYHPCQLYGEAFESCGKWYFYTRKTENRISKYGHWKELTEMDQPIYARNSNKLVGWKKCLLFYKGSFLSSEVKIGWFIQEYHAYSSNKGGEIHRKRRSKKLNVNNWVLCRVQQICDESQWLSILHDEDKYNNEVELSSSDEGYLAMENDEDDINCPY